MSYKRVSPTPVIEGGTNATSMTNTDGVVFFNGTSLATTAVGTATHVLTSNGAGNAPTFQAGGGGGGGITTITGNTGSATGANVTLTGGTSGAIFTGSGSTVTESFDFLALPATTSTNGQVRIGGNTILHAYGINNIYAGHLSGNYTLTGQINSCLGNWSLRNATTGGGSVAVGFNAMGEGVLTGNFNSAVGVGSSKSMTSGTGNCSFGYEALAQQTVGSVHVAIGQSALSRLVGGSDGSIGIGFQAGVSLTTGQGISIGFQAMGNTGASATGINNIAIGYQTLYFASSGEYNVAIGTFALLDLRTGRRNIAIGASHAGFNYNTSESNNILLNNAGIIADSNTLRIGSATGAGDDQLNRSFIHGIRGITTSVNDAIAVLIDSAGQLGTVSSSIRYKENVVDMGDASSPVLSLRPVSFDFIGKPSYKKQIGLIAEEVKEIMPDLVVHNIDGEVESVKYHELPILLLNELQKAIKRIEQLEAKLSSNCKG